MIQTQSIRHDEPQLFTKSDILSGARAAFYPYLVIQDVQAPGGETSTRITQVRDMPDLLAFPDDAVVLWLWNGRSRSDYFRCAVGDIRANRDLIAPSAILPVDDVQAGPML